MSKRQPSYRRFKFQCERQEKFHAIVKRDLMKLTEENHDVSYLSLTQVYNKLVSMLHLDEKLMAYDGQSHREIIRIITTGLHRCIKYRAKHELPRLCDFDDLSVLLV